MIILPEHAIIALTVTLGHLTLGGYHLLKKGIGQLSTNLLTGYLFLAAVWNLLILLQALQKLEQVLGRTWNLILLMEVTLASTAALIMLIIFALREKMPVMAGLFGINLILTFVLSGMARIEEQTIALQWMEEATNSVAWLAFLIAAWHVYQHSRRTYGVDAPAAVVVEPATP